VLSVAVTKQSWRSPQETQLSPLTPMPPVLLAPAILKWEVRHALLKLTAARRVPADTLDVALAPFEAVIQFAPMPDDAGLVALVALARQAELRLFDAAYLGLSLLTAAALASRDGALLAAADRMGVRIIDFAMSPLPSSALPR
jgi:predicted nucleic acid-binding protein